MSEQETEKSEEVKAQVPEPEPQRFFVTTTAQVQRTYAVQAEEGEQAHARLRAFLSDPDALRDGVVEELRDKQNDVTPQRVRSVEAVKQPKQPNASKQKQPDTVRASK